MTSSSTLSPGIHRSIEARSACLGTGQQPACSGPVSAHVALLLA